MKHEGPPLESMLRRLLETPPEFLAEPLIGKHGSIDVSAVVWDLLREIGLEPVAPAEVASFRPTGLWAKSKRNQVRLVLLCCWLAWDKWFLGKSELAAAYKKFLETTVPAIEGFLPVDRLLNDPDRREELVRRMLAELDLRPAGETIAQAADRLQTLDSAERTRVLRDSAAAEKRAQEIREAMARATALDSASRFGE